MVGAPEAAAVGAEEETRAETKGKTKAERKVSYQVAAAPAVVAAAVGGPEEETSAQAAAVAAAAVGGPEEETSAQAAAAVAAVVDAVVEAEGCRGQARPRSRRSGLAVAETVLASAKIGLSRSLAHESFPPVGAEGNWAPRSGPRMLERARWLVSWRIRRARDVWCSTFGPRGAGPVELH